MRAKINNPQLAHAKVKPNILRVGPYSGLVKLTASFLASRQTNKYFLRDIIKTTDVHRALKEAKIRSARETVELLAAYYLWDNFSTARKFFNRNTALNLDCLPLFISELVTCAMLSLSILAPLTGVLALFNGNLAAAIAVTIFSPLLIREALNQLNRHCYNEYLLRLYQRVCKMFEVKESIFITPLRARKFLTEARFIPHFLQRFGIPEDQIQPLAEELTLYFSKAFEIADSYQNR